MKLLRPFRSLSYCLAFVALGSAIAGCSFTSNTTSLLSSHSESSALKKEASPKGVVKSKVLSSFSQSELIQQLSKRPVKLSGKYSPIGMWPILKKYKGSTGKTAILLFSSNSGGLYAVWDDLEVTLLIKGAASVYSYDDGQGLVAASRRASLDLYDVAELLNSKKRPTPKFELTNLDVEVLGLEFNRGEDALAFIGSDGRLYRWRYVYESKLGSERLLDRGKSLEIYPISTNLLSSLAIHPSGRVLTVGDWSGRLSFALLYTSDRFQGEFDPNIFGGNFFIDKTARRTLNRTDKTHVLFVRYDRLGLRLAVASESGSISLYNVRGLKEILQKEKAHIGRIKAFDFNSRGDVLVSCGRDGFLKIWSVAAASEEEARDAKLSLLHEENLDSCTALKFVMEDYFLVGTSHEVKLFNVKDYL